MAKIRKKRGKAEKANQIFHQRQKIGKCRKSAKKSKPRNYVKLRKNCSVSHTTAQSNRYCMGNFFLRRRNFNNEDFFMKKISLRREIFASDLNIVGSNIVHPNLLTFFSVGYVFEKLKGSTRGRFSSENQCVGVAMHLCIAF